MFLLPMTSRAGDAPQAPPTWQALHPGWYGKKSTSSEFTVIKNIIHMCIYIYTGRDESIYIQWGPTATKPEMLVFETPKTGLLKVSLRTHNHMLSTQLPRAQAYTHREREGPWMQGMVSCKQTPPFLDLLRSMSAQHGETYKATFTMSGPWLRMWQWNSDEYSWH